MFCSSDYTVEEQPSEMLLIQELESGRPKPLVFVLNANLLAMVKLVNCMFVFFFSLCMIQMHRKRQTGKILYAVTISYRLCKSVHAELSIILNIPITKCYFHTFYSS